MRPLNRPMFRYGGPIKEGIMDGIREPKKNGGAMKAALVGNPVYPKSDGREHHYAVASLIPAGIQAIRIGAQRAIPKIANFFRTQTGSIGPGVAKVRKLPPNTAGRNLSKNIETVQKSGPELPIYSPNFLGRDPTVRLVGGVYKAVTDPRVAGVAGKAARVVFSPTGAITGLLYANGKFFNKDTGEEVPPPPNAGDLKIGDKVTGTSGAPGGGDPGMYLEPQGEPPPPGKSAEELRKDRIQKYRDIMDIKGMNKAAAYDSLIAASQAINESGDFKGDLKSGKLINQVIQATSKAFDKPKQTKDAIDTLILKGEIEKDIKASDPKAQRQADLLEKQILLADKQLAGDTLQDTVNAIYAKTGAFPSGSGLAGVARTKGIDVKDVARTEEVNTFLETNPGKDAVDFMEFKVQETIKLNKPIEPGAYVVKDRIIVIDSEGNVSPYL